MRDQTQNFVGTGQHNHGQQQHDQGVRPNFPDTLLIHTGPESALPLSLADISPDAPLVLGRRDYPDEAMKDALNFDVVSREHCRFSVRDGTVLITDLGSTNGTFVNGVRLTAHVDYELKNGETVSLADRVEMVFIARRARAEGAPNLSEG